MVNSVMVPKTIYRVKTYYELKHDGLLDFCGV